MMTPDYEKAAELIGLLLLATGPLNGFDHYWCSD
jgi:hypothetical protein